MATATCRTPDCPSEGVGIEVETTYTDSVTGETVPIGAVVCGECGQPITDITDGDELEDPNRLRDTDPEMEADAGHGA